ncbi:tetraspanin-36-like [Lissotriton helveticus]
MDLVIAVSKAVLLLLSLAFWAVAFLFIGFGGYSFYKISTFEYHDDYLFKDSYTMVFALVALGFGVLFFIVGIFGMWATCAGNYYSLGLFKNITQFFFLVELGIFIASVYTLTKGLSNMADKIHDIMQKYNGYNAQSQSLDYGQQQLQCCGAQGYFDWEFTPWFDAAANNSAPLSCCVHPQNCTGSLEQPEDLFSEGCAGKLFEKWKKNATISLITSVILLVLTVFGKLGITQIRNRDFNYVRLF